MPTRFYYPKEESQQLLWFTNLRSKLPGYATTIEISPAALAACLNDLDNLIYWWQELVPSARAYAKSVTSSRDLLAAGTGSNPVVPTAPDSSTPPATSVLPGALSRLFEAIGDWKRAPGCTSAIRKDLGITGPEAPVHADPPVLKLRMQGTGWVEMNFSRWEHDGVWIESRRQGAEVWAYLAIDTARPFKDERPNLPGQASEWREYRACWWDDATPTLAFGPVLRVNVGS